MIDWVYNLLSEGLGLTTPALYQYGQGGTITLSTFGQNIGYACIAIVLIVFVTLCGLLFNLLRRF